MDAARAAADEWGLPIHLDGARLFNAAAALQVEAREIAARADSVMFCLSKGLCAPVGSLLAGTRDFVEAARLKRKIMGGALRQAGILAAAGLVALQEQTARLAEDHRRAQCLAKGLAAMPGIAVKSEDTDINMVFFSFAPAREEGVAAEIVDCFAKRNIKISAPDRSGLFRFVTHYWIGDSEIAAILEAAGEAFGNRGKPYK
jgi:threonine aldolase